MTKLAGAAALVLVLSAVTADAARYDLPADRHDVRGYVVSVSVHPYRSARPRLKAKPKSVKHAIVRKMHHRHGGRSLSLDHVRPELAAKVREIIGACGTKVVSAHRPGARIAGSGHASLHARYPAEAVDVAGDPKCVYARLKGWKGGYSTDYAAVRHIHISLASDRRERGVRFAHYRSHRYAYRQTVSAGPHW
jgi:hypothetical protein